MSDAAAIRAVIDARISALHAKDAEAATAVLAPDIRAFELVAPLMLEGPAARDARGLAAWLSAWDGPPRIDTHDLRIETSGDLAVAHGLMRLRGRKTSGAEVDLWHRSTLVFRRTADGWRIIHGHSSVPFAIDAGGARAMLELRP